MKKVLSLVAMFMMVASLTACMDDPNGSKQTTKSDPAGDTKHVSTNN